MKSLAGSEGGLFRLGVVTGGRGGEMVAKTEKIRQLELQERISEIPCPACNTKSLVVIRIAGGYDIYCGSCKRSIAINRTGSKNA